MTDSMRIRTVAILIVKLATVSLLVSLVLSAFNYWTIYKRWYFDSNYRNPKGPYAKADIDLSPYTINPITDHARDRNGDSKYDIWETVVGHDSRFKASIIVNDENFDGTPDSLYLNAFGLNANTFERYMLVDIDYDGDFDEQWSIVPSVAERSRVGSYLNQDINLDGKFDCRTYTTHPLGVEGGVNGILVGNEWLLLRSKRNTSGTLAEANDGRIQIYVFIDGAWVSLLALIDAIIV